MKNNDFEVKHIKTGDLLEYINKYIVNNKDDANAILPITPIKARSKMQNPCADPSDIGLIVINDGRKCIGYLGLLPNWLTTSSGSIKINWMSSWYVDAAYRNYKLGGLLVQEAKNLGRPVVSLGGSTPGAYPKLGFFSLKPVFHSQLYFEKLNILNRFSLTRKLSVLSSISRTFSYFLTNLFIQSYANKFISKKVGTFDYSKCSNSSNEGFYRGVDSIKWMLNFPWVVDSNSEKELNYAFSYKRESFNYHSYLIYDKSMKEEVGFAILMTTIYNGRRMVKLLDYYAENRPLKNYVLHLALKESKKHKASCLKIPNELRMLYSNLFLKFISTDIKEHAFFYAGSDSNQQDLACDDIATSYNDGDQHFF